ncbi:MAG: DUF2975 domain-containing protein [Oscillospiraceae bacterium]|nr:DUF2975 domain-containing protein [Oscillospiraceae bacterium]
MKISAAKATLFFNRFLAAVMVGLIFFLPSFLDWYVTLRPAMRETARLALVWGFYCCAPAVFFALWELDRMLRAILGRQVFVWRNVKSISRVRWCCLAVSLICLPAAVWYPPIIFMSIIMFFLTLILSVLANVMAAAVEIREENDLTV